MSITHDFIIEAKLPDEIPEAEEVRGTIRIQNKSKEKSPSFLVVAYLCWTTIDTKVFLEFKIPELSPKKIVKFDFSQSALASGYMGIFLDRPKITRNNHTMKFHRIDGRSLTRDLWFASIRVKSISEILQEKLIETTERSIKSQDRLANVQIALTIVGAGIALLQLLGMFLV